MKWKMYENFLEKYSMLFFEDFSVKKDEGFHWETHSENSVEVSIKFLELKRKEKILKNIFEKEIDIFFGTRFLPKSTLEIPFFWRNWIRWIGKKLFKLENIDFLFPWRKFMIFFTICKEYFSYKKIQIIFFSWIFLLSSWISSSMPFFPTFTCFVFEILIRYEEIDW